VRVLLAAAALSAIAAAAQAQVPKPDIYGSLGYQKRDDSGIDAIQLRLGGRFGPNFGIEGEYAKGVEPDTLNLPTVPPGQFKSQLRGELAAYGVGYLPINPNFDLFARVGYGRSWTKRTFALPPNLAVVKDDVGSFNYGVGAQYFLDGKNGLRVDYTRQDRKRERTDDTYAIAYTRRF
jgi:outer membrane immunogenic protein